MSHPQTLVETRITPYRAQHIPKISPSLMYVLETEHRPSDLLILAIQSSNFPTSAQSKCVITCEGYLVGVDTKPRFILRDVLPPSKTE